MFDSPVKIRDLILVGFFSLIVILGIVFISLSDNTTKIVFCDVGQGDGAYIRVKNKIDIVIDAGPDQKILSCLGRYMPFYDRKIELAFISHPQKDHFGGFLYLLDRYKIDKIFMTQLNNPSQSFSRLKQKILIKKIPITFPTIGTRIKILNDYLVFYWPSKEYVKKNVIPAQAGYSPPSGEIHLIDSRLRGNDKGDGGNDKRDGGNDKSLLDILGTSSANDNNFSLVFGFEEGGFWALFTGDATAQVLNEIITTSEVFPSRSLSRTSFRGSSSTSEVILKIPHHGSKNGLNKKFLQLADPAVAVISVGKNNSYGHPAREVLDALAALKIKVRRTDKEGDIVFRLR